MAKEMIDKVVAAEQKAEQIVRDADALADKTVNDAKVKAENIVKSAVSAAKKQYDVSVSTAENNAYKARAKHSADNTAAADEYIQNARANFDKAVDAVISEIIPE